MTQIRSVYGTVLVEYSYDAWGNVLLISGMYANTLGVDNPIRYRGYYYDFETDFYYLQSRYYDPAMGRFINADDTSMIAANGDFASYNLYAYCGNNPVARHDDGGEFWHIAVGAFVGGLIGATTKLISNWVNSEKNIWDGVVMAAVTGAASGALAATGVGLVGQIAGGAAISMAGNAIQQGIDISQGEQESFNVKDMIFDGVVGGIAGAVGGAGASQGNTKAATKLGKQLTKRICNTGEIKKAFAYYGKNMKNGAGKSIYRGLGRAFLGSGGVGLASNFLKSLVG